MALIYLRIIKLLHYYKLSFDMISVQQLICCGEGEESVIEDLLFILFACFILCSINFSDFLVLGVMT